MPTRPYQHDDPDVYRLPLENDRIPYRFEQKLGWQLNDAAAPRQRHHCDL